MSDQLNKLRKVISDAAGTNDNGTQQERPVVNVFYGPVTIVVSDSKQHLPPHFLTNAKTHMSDTPAYLTRRRALLAELPPYEA
jgi:hypothetical protein